MLIQEASAWKFQKGIKHKRKHMQLYTHQNRISDIHMQCRPDLKVLTAPYSLNFIRGS